MNKPLFPRAELLTVLAEMPEEAFSWITVAIQSQIFPDGLGGFMPESRASILKAQDRALSYMQRDTSSPPPSIVIPAVEDNPDYITVMQCVNPRKAMVVVMHYDKAGDSYSQKKCSDVLSHKGATALAESWAAALQLEIR